MKHIRGWSLLIMVTRAEAICLGYQTLRLHFTGLVGIYILNVLDEKFGKERVGLYRDDGLTCFVVLKM